RSPRSIGLLGEALAFSTYYLLGPELAARLESPLAEVLGRDHGLSAGVSRLPFEAGLLVRTLASDSEELRAIQQLILDTARRQLRDSQRSLSGLGRDVGSAVVDAIVPSGR